MRSLRRAAISGRETDEAGGPVAARVHVLTARDQDGDITLVPVPEARPALAVTDEQGAYRLYGLSPGTYYVGVSFGLVGAGTAGHETTSEEVRRARECDDDTHDDPPDLTMFAPTFYPAAPSWRDAVPITLREGEARDDVDVRVPLVHGFHLRGRVQTEDGAVPSAPLLALRPADPYIPAGSILGAAGSGVITSLGGIVTPPITADGQFTIRSLRPGSYLLTARAVAPEHYSAPGHPEPFARTTLFTQLRLTLDGTTRDLTVTLRPAAMATQQLHIDRPGGT